MDINAFRKMKKQFGTKVSWAIWNEDKIVDTSVINEDVVPELKPQIVFVGLNRNKGKNDTTECSWYNFHSEYQGCKDYRLVKAFNRKPFRGAFMTDIDITLVSNRAQDAVPDFESFEKQLNILDCDQYYVVPFGRRVRLALKQYLQQNQDRIITITNVPVYHYSAWGYVTNDRWMECVDLLKNDYEEMIKKGVRF